MAGCALAAALTLVFSGAAQAQGGIKIGGQVVDEAGQPVIGVSVILTPVDANWQPTGAVVQRVEVKKKGRFAFGFAKRGDYLLSVEAEALQLISATVRLRDADRKPVYGPDGMIEDLTAPVDPARPVVPLAIPRDAVSVQMELTVGQPKAASAGGGGLAIGKQIVQSGLGDQVEDLLAKLEARQFQAALAEVDTLLVENPELAPLHYLRGFTLVRLEDLTGAEGALREALRLDPEIPAAAGLLGQIYGEQGRYDEAVPELRRELDRSTDPVVRGPALLGLGQALIETGEYEEAVIALEEALELDPENTGARVQLIDAYTRSGNEEAAEKLMTEGLEGQAAAILHFNLAANMLRTERYEKGAEHLRQALTLDPAMADAHKYLAQAYLALNQRAEAIAEYEAYVEAAPDAPDADQTRRIIAALRQALEESE